MAFEKTTRDPLVDCDSYHETKQFNAVINIISLFSLFNCFEEEGLERLKWVLVHVVNDPQLDEQEVKHGTFCSDGAVRLSWNVNFFLGLPRNNLLLLDLNWRFLSLLTRHNQIDILENCLRVSTNELVKQVSFEICQSDDELLLLVCELLFFSIKLRLLNTDDHSKKLVLKTTFSYNKVHDCALSSSLRLVVRVNQLSLNIKLEGFCNFHFLRSKFDKKSLALLDELSWEQRIENSVDFLADSVNHESLTSADGELNFLLPVGSSELDSNHLTSLFSANPFDTLELRIDQERIATAGHYDSRVLNRNSISWESFRGPRSLLGRRGKNCQRVNSIREWNLQILHIGNPSLSPKHVSELEREGSDVGHKRSRDQSISDHRQLFSLVGHNVSLPSDIFISKTVDETVS